MKNDTKRIDLRLSLDTYNKLLKLNSLRLAAERKNISLTKTLSDIIDERFQRAIG